MTDYPQLQEHLNRLSELLKEIEDKEKEILTSITFNEGCVFHELIINVGELIVELKALKSEYNQLLTKIKII